MLPFFNFVYFAAGAVVLFVAVHAAGCQLGTDLDSYVRGNDAGDGSGQGGKGPDKAGGQGGQGPGGNSGRDGQDAGESSGAGGSSGRDGQNAGEVGGQGGQGPGEAGGQGGQGPGEAGGQGGGPVDVDTSSCEPQCEKISRSDCPKKPEKNVCMRRCKTIAEGIATNTDCYDEMLASQACFSAKPVVCDKDGAPGYGKEVCKAETEPYAACIWNRASDPRSEQICDARIRAACPEDFVSNPGGRDMCIMLYRGQIMGALISVKCWPKMDAFLECESKSAFTCVEGVSTSSEECERLGADIKSCMKSEGLL